jgi:hypothetical protein
MANHHWGSSNHQRSFALQRLVYGNCDHYIGTQYLGRFPQGTQGVASQPPLSLTLLSQDINLAPDTSQLAPSNANSFDAHPALLQSYQSDLYNLWTDLAPQRGPLFHAGLVFQLR